MCIEFLEVPDNNENLNSTVSILCSGSHRLLLVTAAPLAAVSAALKQLLQVMVAPPAARDDSEMPC